MRINRPILTEKDVLIFLKDQVNDELENGYALFEEREDPHACVYMYSRASDLLTEIIKEYEV